MTDTHLQTRSSTAIVLEELQLYGWRPFTDEPDPRPLPEPDAIRTAITDIFDAIVSSLSDTRLEPDLEDLLWSMANLFHRTSTRINRELDSNEQAQKRSQREQDGSEVRSVELETLIAEGRTLIVPRSGSRRIAMTPKSSGLAKITLQTVGSNRSTARARPSTDP